MVRSWTSKQMVMALTVSCGFLGLVLKLSGEWTSPTAPHDPSSAGPPTGRDGSNPTRPHREPAQIASDAGEGGNLWSDWVHVDGIPSGQKFSDVGSKAGGDRPGRLTPRALRRLERMRGKKGPRSLRAGAGGEHSGAPGQRLVGGATDSTTTASAAADSDIALTSESGIQYATESQVEVGDVGKITGPAGAMSFWLMR